MAQVEYNIEFAHYYLQPDTMELSQEQLEGVAKTQEVVQVLRARGAQFALSVLVDDINGTGDFDPVGLNDALDAVGLKPQFILAESALSLVGDDLIDALPPRYLYQSDEGVFLSTRTKSPLLWAATSSRTERDFLEIFIDRQSQEDEEAPADSGPVGDHESVSMLKLKSTNGEHSCVLLTACWHLMRLDIAPFDKVSESLFRIDAEPFFAEKIVTILPTEYIKLEAAAMDILSLAKPNRIRRARHNAEYVFF